MFIGVIDPLSAPINETVPTTFLFAVCRMIATFALVTILTCALVMYLLFRIWNFLKIRNIINRIPGPKSFYVIGNILDIFGDSGKILECVILNIRIHIHFRRGGVS